MPFAISLQKIIITCDQPPIVLSHPLTGRPVTDEAVQASVARHLNAFASAQAASEAALALVETAGGPASPGPSGRLQVRLSALPDCLMERSNACIVGRKPDLWEAQSQCHHLAVLRRGLPTDFHALQCDIYRPLRLPAVLVGDGKLGGISTTLAACELLTHRGYHVAAVALQEAVPGANAEAIRQHLASELGTATPVFHLPPCSPPPGRWGTELPYISQRHVQVPCQSMPLRPACPAQSRFLLRVRTI